MTVAVLPHHTQERSTVRERTTGPKQLPRRKLPLATKHQQQQRVVSPAPCVAVVTVSSSSSSFVVSAVPPFKSKLLGHMKSNYCRRGPPRRSHQVPRISMAAALRHTIDLCSDDSDDSESDSSSDHGGSKHVQFAKRCTVVEIPHYREYSPEQKELLWNGRKEIRTMARRNTLEYQYDGWTVDSAAEEDQFVLVRGEHVHPCHAPAEEDEEASATSTTTTTLHTTIPRDAE